MIDATRRTGGDSALYPDIDPYATGWLRLDALHTMYWETCGNAQGIPLVFLHGGPGGGCLPHHRRFYDPSFWNIVLYDQRGAGRSTPAATLQDNTTPHLLADLERLRETLRIERWLVFGGSWGSTLALAYAQAHPERVLGLVLRGIFLATPTELDWFLHGMRTVFPEAWRAFANFIPADERGDLLAAYHRRLNDPDPAIHMAAAYAWDRYEGACSTLLPQSDAAGKFDGDDAALAIARIEAHYFVHRGFLPTRRPARRNRADSSPALHDRAGSIRHRLPAGHRRRTRARLAGGRLHRGAGCGPLGARARDHPRTRRCRAPHAGACRRRALTTHPQVERSCILSRPARIALRSLSRTSAPYRPADAAGRFLLATRGGA